MRENCDVIVETTSGESMAHIVTRKINARLKFLHRKNKYLKPNLHCLLCSVSMQPRFDYACSAWYPSLSEKLKTRIQTLQKKCIHFCLQLNKMYHISQKGFEIINWLRNKERYNQCVNSVAFKYYDNQYPYYLNEVFIKTPESST